MGTHFGYTKNYTPEFFGAEACVRLDATGVFHQFLDPVWKVSPSEALVDISRALSFFWGGGAMCIRSDAIYVFL